MNTDKTHLKIWFSRTYLSQCMIEEKTAHPHEAKQVLRTLRSRKVNF